MSDDKTVGGKGRLTKERMDSFQRYYGKTIGENKEDLGSMQNATWAILFHSAKLSHGISIEKQNQFCPKGPNSLCKFNACKGDYSSTMPPSAFFELQKPIIERP